MSDALRNALGLGLGVDAGKLYRSPEEKAALQEQVTRNAQQWMQIQNQFAAQNTPPPLPPPPTSRMLSLQRHARARALLLDRLGGINGPFEVKENDFLMCHVCNDLVYVFFVFDGHEGTTKDPAETFPSDKLVAQLRLVLIA